MKIVIASENQGKLQEIEAFFQKLYSSHSNAKSIPIRVIAQKRFSVPSIEETGLSFIENAILKARHAAKYSQLPALADDSGLVVDALNGAPGIYSARYAGPNATMQLNIQKLLEDTTHIEDAKRTAHFYCVIAFVRHEKDPVPIIASAKWDGMLLREVKGNKGFGYDPLFWIPSLGCTAAELDANHKNQLSHRAQALRLFASAFGLTYR